jgi:hypothetical protein
MDNLQYANLSKSSKPAVNGLSAWSMATKN